MITIEDLDFLRNSNNIEDEWDDLSLQDAIIAWQYLKNQEELTIRNILETHALLMLHRDTIRDSEKGLFRTGPVWIGGKESKSFYAIPTLMDDWVQRTNYFLDPKVIEGIEDEMDQRIRQEHVLFESIHPFFDGNGRIGRCLMNWLRVRIGLPVLIIKEKEKQAYYSWFK